MQLGKVIADYLEKFFQGERNPGSCYGRKGQRKDRATRKKIGAIVDRIVD